MLTSRLLASGFALALVLCGSGCTTAELAGADLRHGGPPVEEAVLSAPAAPPAGLVLPDIGALEPPVAAPRTGSFTEAGLRRDASAYEAGLAHNRVTPAAPLAVYSPAFAQGNSGTEHAAFAIYRLDCSGYDREPQLYLAWDSSPSNGTLYIGLADFDAAQWNWFQPVDSASLGLGAIAPYQSPADGLYVAVVLLGDQAAALASLRLGQPRPEAALSADPLSGVAPLTVSFDAGASTAPTAN
jgi:hypothetical protein